jgi:hypothetical protein
MHALLREFADNDRAHDPWGACLGALGPICDLMTSSGKQAAFRARPATDRRWA